MTELNEWFDNLPTPQKDFLLCLEGLVFVIIMCCVLGGWR